MCDGTTIGVIHDVVNEKVNSGNMFTAFDITLDVQAKLKNDGLFDPALHRHRYIKNDIHGVLEIHILNQSYQRQLLDVGAPEKAFVYHPAGSDPNLYVPRPRSSGPGVAVISSGPVSSGHLPAPSTSTVVDDDEDDTADNSKDDYRTPDGRGTVCVPASLLRNVGFQPQDSAYVYMRDDDGETVLVVAKTVPDGHSPVTTYTVDSYWNVRITKFVFEYGKMVATGYAFTQENDEVVVKAQ